MRTTAFYRKALLLVAALFLTASTAAFAQEAAREPNEEITIEPPYGIHVKKSIEAEPFREATRVSISRSVNYSDLDLSKPWGETLLEIRIREVARDVCNEIDRRYPPGLYIPVSDDTSCVPDAVNEAMHHAKAMIAARKSNTAIAGLR